MIKGAIFDVDGVLLDSMSAWENLGQMYLKHLGISAEADLGEILSPMSLEEAARYLIDHYGLKWKPEEVVRGINQELKEFYEHQVLLKPGVRFMSTNFAGETSRWRSLHPVTGKTRKRRWTDWAFFHTLRESAPARKPDGEKPSGRLLCGRSVFFIRIQKKHGFLRMRSMPYGQQKGLDFRQSGCTTGQMKKIRERSGRRRIFT